MSGATDIRPLMNLAEVPLADWGSGGQFHAKIGSFGRSIGARQLGCMLTVVPPGRRAFPHHAHHANEEMFVILAGSGEYHVGDATWPIKAGDIVSAPAGGPETAHHIENTGAEELRYLGISTMHHPEVTEYPDSGKFAILSRPHPSGDRAKAGLRFFGRREMSINYWDGE